MVPEKRISSTTVKMLIKRTMIALCFKGRLDIGRSLKLDQTYKEVLRMPAMHQRYFSLRLFSQVKSER